MAISIQDKLIDQFLADKAIRNGHANKKFSAIKDQAMQDFSADGIPETKFEEWKYTNLKKYLDQNDFNVDIVNDSLEKIETKYLLSKKYNLLVLVNGIYSDRLSNIKDKRINMYLGCFNKYIHQHSEVIEKYFCHSRNLLKNPMYSLNTAMTKDGLLMVIPDGVILDEPLHILNINTDQGNDIFSQYRNLIIAGKNSQVSVVETYESEDKNKRVQNNATEIFVDEFAIFNYYKLQNINNRDILIDSTFLNQSRSSTTNFYTFSSGGKLIRNDLNISLDDENCEANMYGLTLAKADDHIDHHTLIDHAFPNCISNELYKGVYSDSSRGVFNGKVYVRQDAQNTRAYQSNPNLLLSDDARIDTKPQLEIFADDVKCSHGATVGQLDKDSIFYMRSRGINEQTSKGILTYAFASEMIDAVKLDVVKKEMRSQALSFFKLDIE